MTTELTDTYQAIVAPIAVYPIPGADKIQRGVVAGCTVVVGSYAKTGDLYLFFPSDGQLSPEFTEAHNLVRRTDAAGNQVGGYFEPNRRVRAIKLKGIRSDGFAVPTSYLEFTGTYVQPKEGDRISKYNGVPICNKYETKATKAAKEHVLNRAKKTESISAPMFRKHFQTDQLEYWRHTIPKDATLIVTEKLHGTSQRYGNVLVTRPLPLPWYKRAMNVVLPGTYPVQTTQWEHVVGTRNVLLDPQLGGTDTFYSNDSGEQTSGFRYNVIEPIRGKLHKGETLYFEVVGYTHTYKPIMNPQPIKDTKSSLKRFGSVMEYSYGCDRGACAMYVYRITHTNEDGVVHEVPWYAVQARCKELGTRTVPEYARQYFETVDEVISTVSIDEGHSILSSQHIGEGVCVRVEHPDLFAIFKYKSHAFKVLEGIVKDDPNQVDMEEAS